MPDILNVLSSIRTRNPKSHRNSFQ